MQTFYSLSTEQQNTAVALGYFDGVHRGHRRVLGAAAEQRKNGLLPVCLTFSESPKSITAGIRPHELMTRADKLRALEQTGMEHVYFQSFRPVMNLSAREFFDSVLLKALNAKWLFCGFNYRFGKNAEGNTETLAGFCRQSGVELTVIPPETDGGEVICSTLIKNLIARGDIERANRLLGARFGFAAEVTHGKKLGRELGAPTINQGLAEGLAVPRFGVYASRVTLEDGRAYCGVTNVGIKPTVGGTVPLWETWMPQYTGGELYGQTADVRLLKYIRPEKKFDSLDALKAEIKQNGQTALAVFAGDLQNT